MGLFRVRIEGFKEGQAMFTKAGRLCGPIINEELVTFSKEAIAKLKDLIYNAELRLRPKERSDGNPPLVHTGRYVESYVYAVKDGGANLGPTGMNENMSNEDLGDLLEFGTKTMPARPHLRPLGVWVDRQLPLVGERIVNALLK